MKARMIAVALCAGMTLAGCAEGAAQRRSAPIAGESTASSVMRGAGFGGHRDAENARASAMGAVNLGAVTGGDLVDLGNIAVTGLTGVVSAFAISSDSPDDFSQIMAWPPADYAPTAVEAQRRFFREVEEAVEISRLSAGFADTTMTVERLDNVGARRVGKLLRVVWPETTCPVYRQNACVFWVNSFEDNPPDLTTGPAILSSEKRWAFRYKNSAMTFRPLGETDDFPPRRVALVDEMTLYEAISRNLPDWAFIYVAPFTAGYLPEGSYKPLFYPAPVVLNRGLAHYFVVGQTAGVPLVRNFGSARAPEG
jgi:hypothetical protein